MARVLTLNGGSSSIKFALFERIEPPTRALAGEVEGIGLPGAQLRSRAAGASSHDALPITADSLEEAGEALVGWLEGRCDLRAVEGVGHRIVHGGPRLTRAQRITPEVLEELRRIGPLDPNHLPGEIALVTALLRLLPDVPHVACFDTAFHRDLPRVARLLAVPRRFEERGVRRYGFHGLSYAFLLQELERLAGRDAARGRIVFAHLGSGSSMAAVREGRCVDTTMSLTPTAGLVMGTRSGDLDPGFLLYLLRQERMGY
jgi:acetate kinase